MKPFRFEMAFFVPHRAAQSQYGGLSYLLLIQRIPAQSLFAGAVKIPTG